MVTLWISHFVGTDISLGIYDISYEQRDIRLDEGMRKKVHGGQATYLLRMTEADYVRWRADAERRGKNFADWVRESLNLAAGRVPVVSKEPAPPAREPEVTPDTPAREPDAVPAPGLGGVSRLQSPPGGFVRMRETAKELAARSGKCSADVARGTRCKLCGKIH